MDYATDADGRLLWFKAHDTYGNEILCNAMGVAVVQPDGSHGRHTALIYVGGHYQYLSEPYEEIIKLWTRQ